MAQSPKPSKTGDMRIDPELVRELAGLLTENALTEIEVADGERRIKVARSVIGAAPAPAAAPASTAAQKTTAAEPAAEEVSGTAVKSPMVGTAFLSAEPGA